MVVNISSKPSKEQSFCECFWCMCSLKVLSEFATMACFPVGTRKKRWHTAGSFSTAFNIFQNSEAKPVRKSWWSFTKRISVSVKPVVEIFFRYRFEDTTCWLERSHLNTEKQPSEWRLIKCTLHSIRQVTILNIWWNQFPMHRFFGKIKKKEIDWNSILYRLEWRDFVQSVKIGVQSREKGSYQKMVSCFFLCPDADCSRINLFRGVRQWN